jgi:hypothetical protein
MQQSEDIQYDQLLNNLQEYFFTEDDFSLFKSHFLSKLQLNLVDTLGMKLYTFSS